MDSAEIIKFLKTEIEPYPDQMAGTGYRAAAYLKDGTYLPAVIFRNPKTKVDLAIKRFAQEKAGEGIIDWGEGKDPYRAIVQHFVTRGNQVNEYDIEKVERSPYAIPVHILETITGETTMGWTGFVLKMKDGQHFGFGTPFLFEFFQLPEGYVATDVLEVINHNYLSMQGEVKAHQGPFFKHPEDYDESRIHRERPYFECYLENL